MSSFRPVVTAHEASVITDVLQKVAASETFFCQGKLHDLGVPSPILFYTANDTAKMMNLVNPTPASLSDLHEDCQPSHFGQGRETVMDESYRLAREMLGDRFNLNFDPLAPRAGVLASVSAFCKNSVEAALYKLNCYTTGGHFKAHRDTPKATNHIGTLLIGLPAPFSGGELILRKGGEVIIVDWSTEGRKGDNSFPWIFFYSDVEHEILPVTSGHRLTVAYDVYSSDSLKYITPAEQQAADPKTTALYSSLQVALKDSEFLVGGGRLAFALSYEYPAAEMQKAKVFNAILKGSDNALWHALDACGLDIEVKAAYKAPESQENKQVRIDAKRDDFGPCVKSEYSRDILMTAKSFAGIDPSCEEGEYGDSFRNLLIQCVGAKTELDLIWTSKPDNFALASTFASYGNEPSTNHSYVAGVLVATVSPVGEGCRK